MRALLTALLVLALATPAMAAFSGPGAGNPPAQGGFQGPRSGGVNKAADVARAYDDAHVILEGFIIEQVSHDKYIFRDDTGTVVVDIDRKKFRGQNVTPQTRVRIVGEVDFDHGSKEVDVDYLEVIR